MADRPNPGLAALIAAKIACCGGLVLVSTGALSIAGVAGWLRDGGIFWLAIVALAAVALYLWRRPRRADPLDVPTAETGKDAAAVDSIEPAGADSTMADAAATSPRIDAMMRPPRARPSKRPSA
jgi:uncharacterized membrane protein YfcA